MAEVEGWGLRYWELYVSLREQGWLWANLKGEVRLLSIFFWPMFPFVLSLSSTPPFSSEEEPEGDVVQRVSLQPPKVLPRSAPQPEDSWGWSDSETSEESAQPPGKGSDGLASSGESFSSPSFSVPWDAVSDMAFLASDMPGGMSEAYFTPCLCHWASNVGGLGSLLTSFVFPGLTSRAGHLYGRNGQQKVARSRE